SWVAAPTTGGSRPRFAPTPALATADAIGASGELTERRDGEGDSAEEHDDARRDRRESHRKARRPATREAIRASGNLADPPGNQCQSAEDDRHPDPEAD